MRTARIYRRFYAALQLRDLCNEVPVHAVAKKYDIPRGFVQSLAQICEGFAAGMISFCDRMGWGMLKSVLEHMVRFRGVIPSQCTDHLHLHVFTETVGVVPFVSPSSIPASFTVPKERRLTPTRATGLKLELKLTSWNWLKYRT